MPWRCSTIHTNSPSVHCTIPPCTTRSAVRSPLGPLGPLPGPPGSPAWAPWVPWDPPVSEGPTAFTHSFRRWPTVAGLTPAVTEFCPPPLLLLTGFDRRWRLVVTVAYAGVDRHVAPTSPYPPGVDKHMAANHPGPAGVDRHVAPTNLDPAGVDRHVARTSPTRPALTGTRLQRHPTRPCRRRPARGPDLPGMDQHGAAITSMRPAFRNPFPNAT